MLDIAALRNPSTGNKIVLNNNVLTDEITGEAFPLSGDIAVMFGKTPAGSLNTKYQKLYDRIWRGYDFVENFFMLFNREGRKVRKSIRDSLIVRPGDKVLETSVGTGINLANLPATAQLYGLDISMGMLTRCRQKFEKNDRDIMLVHGNAEELPFADNYFDCVFHFGGINFFDRKKEAVEEMIRVAKPGAQIMIGDETEKLAKELPAFLSKNYEKPDKNVYAAPLEHIPSSMKNVKLRTIFRDKLYIVTFNKPS